MNYHDFQTRLASLAEDDFRDFAKKGIATDYPLLGVRMPHLRALAKEIAKSGKASEFLTHAPQSFEEVTTQGIVIALLPYDQMKSRIPAFLPLIDNWATCDTFCNSLKSVRTHRADFLELLAQHLSGPEFSARFALVALLAHYVTPDYLAVIYDCLAVVADREEYYVKMAVAWLTAECFIKFPDETCGFLRAGILPKWTTNKAISKIRDSYRVPPEAKSALLTLRK
ncbi:DNA alkylation repair protein [Candidatus Saccharibacteria bacterium]|nr:DNA alkylation repair protein [Candidatus Saccharibacteria bacterium]